MFQPINQAFTNTFKQNRLSLGVVVPIENYSMDAVPEMTRHIERVKLVEQLGFSALWLRDVPFNVSSFGDAGQIYDPFVYLGLLTSATSRISLGVASIILPLRHPAHVAKAAASVDVLSEGRLLLGVASGDRPEEYPAMNVDYHERGQRFRSAFEYIETVFQPTASFENHFGSPNTNGLMSDMDMIPKPSGKKLPLLITGGSQQTPEWLTHHGDGWMTYPRPVAAQAALIKQWREDVRLAGLADKPVMQSLYIDLVDNPNAKPEPIHLGFRSGVNFLLDHLKQLESSGINHVALNLRLNRRDVETTLCEIADKILPEFTHNEVFTNSTKE